jgi:hypothetical protein
MNNPSTFFSGEAAIAYLAEQYGSANYREWQMIPKQFYSYVPYGAAGNSTYTLFTDALGTNGTTRQDTNMPKAGSFGQVHFLLKTIQCKAFIPDPEQDSWDGTDAETLYSDYVNGLFQAGVFKLSIQDKVFVQFPNPFLYAGCDYGPGRTYYAGIEALDLSEGTPNTLDGYRSHSPFASLSSREDSEYLVDPNILIEAEQNFSVNIDYPSGALAPVATGIIGENADLKIGVVFWGLELRPVQ